ncbi:flagellar basal-body MS-ring/collar protein FliF [Piscinibacter gummiphilus]|uniref:Uncharacterized protein n=1 Tax=Piscinibacter gummiphilus TaxID=946333 RepID=A0A1W6L537_9BURK|nr:flagellar basal-body MS-ring/collar protein FliF [Piscinibacter gummiphilus]ARN19332.1 hypothetical protein A4W93_05085 [Piscinibacter gummiphilus]ATU63999.1 flagellar M-ring protein FliF [Piscinibacter gummiphilus]GLS93041.1 hypothetical protein GCM10007918_03320 [Piscinibacter gummiphilus]
MSMQDYWQALNAGQRTGVVAGAAAIVVATAAFGYWALRDPLVPAAASLSPERQATLAAELERAKVPYRLGPDGSTVLVPESAAGRARAAMGTGLGVPPEAGLEIFKESDFSTTDFAQRVNYQRALQGELSRTLQTIDGVRASRVHVVLPESGLLKRTGARAAVAVTLQLEPGRALSRAQVTGIQRLAAASVPDIKAGDVVVLDATGRTLSRGAVEADDDATSGQLDLKRQVDAYVEGKLSRLLAELVPDGQVTLSADTQLDFKQIKVTTEQPVAAASTDAERPAGVLVKERQSQRSGGTGGSPSAESRGSETSDWEYEYKVGHRVEQSLSTPGAVKRLSVAVAIHGAPDTLAPAAVEHLVAHAVGIDRSRGDAMAVVLLPRIEAGRGTVSAGHASVPTPVGVETEGVPAGERFNALATPLLAVMVVILLAVTGWLATRRSVPAARDPAVDEDAAAARVRAWLGQEEAPR